MNITKDVKVSTISIVVIIAIALEIFLCNLTVYFADATTASVSKMPEFVYGASTLVFGLVSIIGIGAMVVGFILWVTWIVDNMGYDK